MQLTEVLAPRGRLTSGPLPIGDVASVSLVLTNANFVVERP